MIRVTSLVDDVRYTEWFGNEWHHFEMTVYKQGPLESSVFELHFIL
jgi:hypothetical protein